MAKRYVSLWFPCLVTDYMIRRKPELKGTAFVVAAPERGRMMVKAASMEAREKGALPGMVVADCRAVNPDLLVTDQEPGLEEKLLTALAEWCIRYTPAVAIDLPAGLTLDASGCAHLWGGEQSYLKDIYTRMCDFGYQIQLAMADTVGAAWALARYGRRASIVHPGGQADALMSLPPAALRLDSAVTAKLAKLGLRQVGSFMTMPRRALIRRFGSSLLQRLDQALGQELEMLIPVQPPVPYQERLPSLDPIHTATGIEIALQQLLQRMCCRLEKEQQGLRQCILKCFRIDGRVQQVAIATNRPSRNTAHLLKLFETHIARIEPDLGIEVFVLEAPVVEDLLAVQEAVWQQGTEEDDKAIAELMDRINGKLGGDRVQRYLPDERYWPERSFRAAGTLTEQAATHWRTENPRPIHVLAKPEPVTAMVGIPDYPPVMFHYKGEEHRIRKADGPERIEQEWWLQQGEYRDYYCVEDEAGRRYWLFRLGSYDNGEPKWFLHGFFA